jgi:hypothetical protein
VFPICRENSFPIWKFWGISRDRQEKKTGWYCGASRSSAGVDLTWLLLIHDKLLWGLLIRISRYLFPPYLKTGSFFTQVKKSPVKKLPIAFLKDFAVFLICAEIFPAVVLQIFPELGQNIVQKNSQKQD